MQGDMNNYASINKVRRTQGFTLIEVILAISIILLALVPLLHLHVRCIQTYDIARRLSKATNLADEQLAKLIIDTDLRIGTYGGRIDDDRYDIVYQWSAVVEDMTEHFLEPLAATGLRRIQLTLDWGGGHKDREVTLESIIRVNDVRH